MTYIICNSIECYKLSNGTNLLQYHKYKITFSYVFVDNYQQITNY